MRGKLLPFVRAGRLALPVHTFYLILPPEERRPCPPAETFIAPLMAHLGTPYYVGLLSAAERYGARGLPASSLQVMVHNQRPAIACGRTRISFVIRNDVDDAPVCTLDTPGGPVPYASPELTALELFGYPRHAGPLRQLAQVLKELCELIDPRRLAAATRRCPIGWAQRLGYMLEFIGAHALAEPLLPIVRARSRAYAALQSPTRCIPIARDPKWRVLINVDAP